MHRRQNESGAELFWVYRYDGKERINDFDTRLIEQILSYKVWKLILSKN